MPLVAASGDSSGTGPVPAWSGEKRIRCAFLCRTRGCRSVEIVEDSGADLSGPRGWLESLTRAGPLRNARPSLEFPDPREDVVP